MEHTIGIDFGTTKTLVSFYDPESKTNRYVRLGRGIDKMPTSIYVGEDGVWQFGDDADDYMSLSPSRYRRDFKLGLGKNAPYLVTKVGGEIQRFTAKDLAAKFLKHIKDQCEEMVFHEPVSSCTVTYPVVFSIAQREELKAAALEAGFEDVSLLPEPEAAGYAYYTFGADKRLSKLMVVDWGGGTVDFAMVKLKGNEVSLVPNSYGGEVNVGGRKFDELLFTHLSRKIVQNGGTCLEDDGDPQLSKQICSCKEQLSKVSAVNQVLLVGRKGMYPKTDVGRSEFNVIITPVVDRVVDQLKELLAKCTEKPEALLLIGGASSIPFIRERLESEIGRKCVVWDNRNEAVSIGAAWYGSTHNSYVNYSSQRLPDKCVLIGVNTGKTICAEDHAGGQLVAKLDVGDGKSEIFTLIKNHDGSVSLQSAANGKFVSAIPFSHGDGSLIVNGPTIDAWEKFELTRVCDSSDEYILRSVVTGKYVSVDELNGNRLFANRDVADAWEKIRIVFGAEQAQRLPDKCVLIGVNTGKTICAEDHAGGQLVAKLDVGDGKSEIFTLIKNHDGSVSLQSAANGKFVSAIPFSHGDGSLIVNGPTIDAWEKFELTRVCDSSDEYILRSVVTGKYVSVDELNGNRLFANRDVVDAWEKIRIIERVLY